MRINRTHSFAPRRTGRHAALPAYGMWIRLGFIGMSLAAGGLLELLGRASSPVTALAWLLSGTVLAVVSVRSAIAALKDMESSGDEFEPANAAIGASVGLYLPAGIARA